MFFNLNRDKKRAFTLAEVLITLGIIGIIAVLTLPTLITNYNKSVWETRLKKDYTIVSNMCERMLTDENTEQVTELDLYKHLGSGNNSDIEGDISRYVQLSGPVTNSNIQALQGKTMVMSDGSVMYIRRINNVGFGFYVDVNGETFPNVYGRDRFGFNLGSDCGYTETSHTNNNAYGTFKAAIYNEWSLPQRPMPWGLN